MSSVARLYAAELDGIHAELVAVEADLSVGLHSFTIVGLADRAVGEAKDRVNAALKHCGINPPTKENRRVTVNLAPADTKKVGSRFDLPIALSYLVASEQIAPFETTDKIFIGELALDGTIRSVNGSLSVALLAKKLGVPYVFVPKQNAAEAAAVPHVTVFPVDTVQQLISHLEGTNRIAPQPATTFSPAHAPAPITLADIKGQESQKRALLVAAAGGHHLLMTGPPGTGKTMLAQALVSLLPPPSLEESIETTQIWSAAQASFNTPLIASRPFRAPHHSASLSALIGGGSYPKPGEVSLAHRGVLFLDEIPEFRRDVLEALRQPLEVGEIRIARAKKALTFPARFLLVAAMNPCPCGYFEDKERECRCSAREVFKYQRKLSGPLLDRIDIQIEVPRAPIDKLMSFTQRDTDQVFQDKVVKARRIQEVRFQKFHPKIYTNAEMTSRQADTFVRLDSEAEALLKQLLEKAFVTGRSYYRILKISQTIADLEESSTIRREHVAEAFQYRVKANE